MNSYKTKQENSGAYQRIAGENYNELHVHFHHCPVCAEKNNLRMPHDERHLIEKSFNDRFGFSLNAELCILVIKLKEQVKLTDPEIILLKRCGALTVKKGKPVTLYSDWISVLACVILIVLCILEVFMFSSLMMIKSNNHLISISFTIVMSVVCFFFVRNLHKISIKPANILRENGIKFGQKYTLSI